jgi:hypothetical protein
MSMALFAESGHLPYIDNPTSVPLTKVDFGDVIIFSYDKKDRLVFVLAGDYEGKLHGLDMTKIKRGDLISVVVPRMYGTGSPYTFYHSMPGVRKVITRTECYRSYTLAKIKMVTRVSYDARPKAK